MPPPKKAAKKSAKKAAKKAAGRHHDPKREADDLRRAFEHMGRLHLLGDKHSSPISDHIAQLMQFSRQAIETGRNKDAADLLRAAEHLRFADKLTATPLSQDISAELEEAVRKQFDHLLRKADEHWADESTRAKGIAAIYQSSRTGASKALEGGAYHQALEFARAAEALAHVDVSLSLDSPKSSGQLRGA